MNLPNVTISGHVLSDLFFNSPLEKYNSKQDEAMDDETIGTEQFGSALLEDAKEFALQFGGQVAPEALVEDFLSRL